MLLLQLQSVLKSKYFQAPISAYNVGVTTATDIHGIQSHWHFLFRRRRRSLGKTTREILIGQLISLSGSIVAGILLELTKSTLIATVGIFLLLPGVFDLGGSVAGAFAAKVNHAFTRGSFTARDFHRSLVYSLVVLSISALVLGAVGGLLASVFFHASFLKVMFTAWAASIVTGLIGLPIIGSLTLLTASKGLDADNFIGPIETSIFDSLTILVIFMLLLVMK
jgi:cation transporter-like permease